MIFQYRKSHLRVYWHSAFLIWIGPHTSFKATCRRMKRKRCPAALRKASRNNDMLGKSDLISRVGSSWVTGKLYWLLKPGGIFPNIPIFIHPIWRHSWCTKWWMIVDSRLEFETIHLNLNCFISKIHVSMNLYKMTTIEFHVYFPSFKTWLHWVVGLSTFCETGACWCRTSWNTYIAMVVDLDSLVKMLLTKGAPKAPKGFGVCVEELNFSDWHDVYRPNEFRILSGKAYIRINSVRFRPPVLFAMHWQTFILVIVLVHFSKNLPPLSEAYESSNWFWKVHGEPYVYI